MKTEIIRRCRTVQSDSPEKFDKAFDKIAEEHPNADLKWHEGLCVSFIYEERRQVAETVAEKFELEGIKYFCKDCPNMLKGSNKRERSHGCKYSEFGMVKDFTPACEFFYRELLQGKITPLEEE